ncbi:MAG: hypothetical protein L0H79_15805 [Intrasporangium sp.]|uniref:hypothetical protein n=1 Tax=Intrasporangium sp. TaxID=1925024 RepID=UPI0026475060|nr:hypothetical protein [Intrasporangium sp.]MDN5797201.1 hypothetical protein [Intrasporangium sp.]
MPTGEAIKTGILLFVGNAFLVFLAVIAFGYWARKAWGDLVAALAGAVLVAGFVYFPTQSVDFLKKIWELVFT